jgi:hypothetical protein
MYCESAEWMSKPSGVVSSNITAAELKHEIGSSTAWPAELAPATNPAGPTRDSKLAAKQKFRSVSVPN